MSEIEHIVLWPFKDTSDLEFATQAIKYTVAKARRDGPPYVLSVKCGTTRPSPPVRSKGALTIHARQCRPRLVYNYQDSTLPPSFDSVLRRIGDTLWGGSST